MRLCFILPPTDFLSAVLAVVDVSLYQLTHVLLPPPPPLLDGAHTGKYTFDTFTHLRSSLDSPSW